MECFRNRYFSLRQRVCHSIKRLCPRVDAEGWKAISAVEQEAIGGKQADGHGYNYIANIQLSYSNECIDCPLVKLDCRRSLK